jgi:Toprim domain-containing protein/DNA primase-like protein/CHC2-type zinc finger protein
MEVTMKNNWVSFQTVKEAVSMEMVLARYNVSLRRLSATSLRGDCPFPSHSSEVSIQSFAVQTAKNAWSCLSASCIEGRGGKRGGSVIDFVAAMERSTIREAALKLQSWFPVCAASPCDSANSPPNPAGGFEKGNGDRSGESTVLVNKPLRFALKDIDWSHPYLAGRGVTKETAFFFGVGGFSGKGSMSGRVVIPIHNELGEFVAYAGRAVSDEKPKYKLPAKFKKSLELFNLHRAIEASNGPLQSVIVVEGFFDAMRVYVSGYRRVVALMGSSLSEAQEELLIKHFQRLIVMLDGDSAGRRASDQMLLRLGRRVWVRAIELIENQQPDQLATAEIQNLLKALC